MEQMVEILGPMFAKILRKECFFYKKDRNRK